STVVISVVLMIIGVFLAILVYLTLSGALPSMYQRQEAALPKTNIAIINFIGDTGKNQWNVTIRNNGPVSLQYKDINEWQVFVDDKRADISSIEPSSSGTIQVNGVIKIIIDNSTLGASIHQPHTVKVFGPQATQAFAGWSPQG
ncbi:MAG: hypothetical protein C0200_06815, partial [Thermoproteota archaeon]